MSEISHRATESNPSSEQERAFNEVFAELRRACAKFGPFNSGHEGYAVILEEVEELWEEITTKEQSKERLRAEATQVAAMAVRFMIDLCGATQ